MITPLPGAFLGRDADPNRISGAVTRTSSNRLAPSWRARVEWHRIVTSYSRDSSIILQRAGYRTTGYRQHLRQRSKHGIVIDRPLRASSMDFPELNTDRLILRPFVASDAAELYAIHSDAEAMRWFGSNPAQTLEDAEKILQFFMMLPQQPVPGMRWAIVRKTDLQLIGSCGFFKWDRAWHNGQIGYELARGAWHQGYMQEALAAMLGWLLANLRLNRIEARVHPHNAASLKLLGKLGFVVEGTQREAGYWHDQYHPLVLLSLLAAEFVLPAPTGAAAGVASLT